MPECEAIWNKVSHVSDSYEKESRYRDVLADFVERKRSVCSRREHPKLNDTKWQPRIQDFSLEKSTREKPWERVAPVGK